MVGTATAVVPVSVVDEDRHRGQAVERGVWSLVIVEPQPAGEGSMAFGVGVIEPGVGPLLQQGAVEPLDLAVGLGPIGPGPLEPDPQPSGRLSKGQRLGVGLGVVGQHPLDDHAMLGEERGRLDQEPGAGGTGLIGQELAEGDPGAVIDGRVNIVIADAPAAPGRRPAMDLVAAAIRDAPELLDVQVDQLTRVLTLIAHHRAAGPVEVGEATHAMAGQHPVDGRAGHPQLPGEAVGALAAARRAASTRRTWAAGRA